MLENLLMLSGWSSRFSSDVEEVKSVGSESRAGVQENVIVSHLFSGGVVW